MTTMELLNSAQFIIDKDGHKKAVVIEVAVWQEIVTALEKLDTLEAASEPEGEEIPPQNQQALALLQAWATEPGDKDETWWDEFEQELRDNRLTFRREVNFN